jgi:hypothetical protein
MTAGLACAQSADPHAVDTVTPSDFVAAGKAYDVDFGTQKFRLEFVSDRELKFTSPDGKNAASVAITVTKIRPSVYMVYWSRRAGQHVVHVEDFENGVAYSNIFMPDGSAQRLKGTLTPVR